MHPFCFKNSGQRGIQVIMNVIRGYKPGTNATQELKIQKQGHAKLV